MIQTTTQSGSKIYNPESFFQVHALWHICAGTGVMCVYFFFLSDKFTMVQRLDQDRASRDNIRLFSEELEVDYKKNKMMGLDFGFPISISNHWGLFIYY